MSEKVQIAGDVGVAVNAEEGAAVHIHVVGSDGQKDSVNWAVYRLLKTCEQADCKQALENVSKQLYGSPFFKRLSLKQLETLQVLANEFARYAQQEQADTHALFCKEMDEYEDFYRRTGIRASKLERTALTEFMMQYQFNPKQVALAWNNTTLYFGDGKLCTRSELLQFGLGVSVVVLGGLFLIGFFGALLLQGVGILSLKVIGQQCVLGITLWMAIKHLIAPTFLAKRMQQALEKYAR